MNKKIETKINDEVEVSAIKTETLKTNHKNRILYFFKETRGGSYLFKIGKTLLPFIVIGLLYEIVAVILNAKVPILDSKILPPMHDIIVFAWNALFPGAESVAHSVFFDIGRSFLRVLIGFGIGVASGVTAGILMGLSKWLYRFLNPIFSLLISIPTLAWVPILIIIFGLNIKTIITTIALSCFFPVVYSTTNGIRSIDKNLIWSAQIMGANKFEIFIDVLLPGSLTSLITGLRLAVGYSWRAVVGAEILVSSNDGIGIGGYLVGGKTAYLPIQILVGILLIALGGLLIDAVLMEPLELLTIKKWGLIEKSKGK